MLSAGLEDDKLSAMSSIPSVPELIVELTQTPQNKKPTCLNVTSTMSHSAARLSFRNRIL